MDEAQPTNERNEHDEYEVRNNIMETLRLKTGSDDQKFIHDTHEKLLNTDIETLEIIRDSIDVVVPDGVPEFDAKLKLQDVVHFGLKVPEHLRDLKELFAPDQYPALLSSYALVASHLEHYSRNNLQIGRLLPALTQEEIRAALAKRKKMFQEINSRGEREFGEKWYSGEIFEIARPFGVASLYVKPVKDYFNRPGQTAILLSIMGAPDEEGDLFERYDFILVEDGLLQTTGHNSRLLTPDLNSFGYSTYPGSERRINTRVCIDEAGLLNELAETMNWEKLTAYVENDNVFAATLERITS